MFSTPQLQINCLQDTENKPEAVGVLSQAHRCILFGQQSFKISEVLRFSVSQKNPNIWLDPKSSFLYFTTVLTIP